MSHDSKNKGPSQRQLRVGEEIRHALSDVMSRGEIRDPDIADMSITVTEVRISPDLRNATAYVTPLGGGDDALMLAALNRCAGFLRGRIGSMVRLRNTPKIAFVADKSFENAAHIDELLRRVHEEDQDD